MRSVSACRCLYRSVRQATPSFLRGHRTDEARYEHEGRLMLPTGRVHNDYRRCYCHTACHASRSHDSLRWCCCPSLSSLTFAFRVCEICCTVGANPERNQGADGTAGVRGRRQGDRKAAAGRNGEEAIAYVSHTYDVLKCMSCVFKGKGTSRRLLLRPRVAPRI